MGGNPSRVREQPMRQRPPSKVPKAFRDVESPYPECRTFHGKYGAMNYSLDGPDDAAELLVTFHGLNASRTMFKVVGEAIARSGIQVLSFDMYGHGRTNAPPVNLWPCKRCRCRCPCGHPRARYDLDEFVDQTVELLDGLGLQKKSLNLIGFSFGGLVAMQFARRYPDKVVRLVLMSPGGFLENRGLKRQWRLGHLFWCCLIPLANYMLSPCCYRKEKWAKSMKGEDPEVVHQVWSRLVWSLFVKRGVAAASLGIMLRVNWFNDEQIYKDIGSHPRPVLLLWGEHDNFNSLETANKMKDYFSNKLLYVINGAYHIVISDKPQRVYDAVYDFLRFPADQNMAEVQVLPAPDNAERLRLYTAKTAQARKLSASQPRISDVSKVEVHANMPAPGIIGSVKPPKPPDLEQATPDVNQL